MVKLPVGTPVLLSEPNPNAANANSAVAISFQVRLHAWPLLAPAAGLLCSISWLACATIECQPLHAVAHASQNPAISQALQSSRWGD